MSEIIAITIITSSGFETVGIPLDFLPELNKELAKGMTHVHTAKKSIECYGYIAHAKGAKNMLAFLGNGSELDE